MPLLLLNHFPDDPVLEALLQFNVRVFMVERIISDHVDFFRKKSGAPRMIRTCGPRFRNSAGRTLQVLENTRQLLAA
jgi:hypothetical protein